MIKVLIVDDSALMRKHLSELLLSEGDFEVLAVRNGAEALANLDAFGPDVITLDINMPEMDGITCLSRIMVSRPTPVVMVSSLTEEGAVATLEAMSLGAVDFVHKPGGTISLSIERIHREILTKVRGAAKARVRRSIGLKRRLSQESASIASRAKATAVSSRLRTGRPGIVLVGVSTGGPGTLEAILRRLPADFPWSIVIAQHMPGSFTGVFARRLNDLCAMTVVEASHQMPIEPSTVYVAKGEADVVITKRAIGYSVTPVPSGRDYLWHPSVQRLVVSALQVVPADRLIGLQLTGMGDDGADAMASLHARGGLTIAQDEETSIVFGMPGELIKRGGASVVLPDEEIPAQLLKWLNGSQGETPRKTGFASAR
jgi:two-component system, chemotaxis family, protein-glutamate methylesterase/glutaminase